MPVGLGSRDLPRHMQALRALRDCEIIRARETHPSYSALVRRGWAAGSYVMGSGDQIDFRLTEAGRAATALLKPLN